MARSGRMQQVVTRVLAVMLVASLALAVVAFVFPQPALADFWQVPCYCRKTAQCGGGYGWFEKWCGSNCSPPCGPCQLQECICP